MFKYEEKIEICEKEAKLNVQFHRPSFMSKTTFHSNLTH